MASAEETVASKSEEKKSEEEKSKAANDKKIIKEEKIEGIFNVVFSKHHKDEKKKFVKKAKKINEPKNIIDDFYVASGAVEKAVFKAAKEDPSYVYLIKSTPGIGKTEAAIALASSVAEQGSRVVYAASNKEQVWQFHDRAKASTAGYGHIVVNLQGRHGGYVRNRMEPDGTFVEVKVKPNCEKIEEVRRAAAKGYSPQVVVCAHCHKCPTFRHENGEFTGYKNACGYHIARGKASGILPVGDGKTKPIIVMTHHMAANVVTDGEMIKPDLLIIDEDFTSPMREIFAWDEDELQRIIVEIPELIRFRSLMRQSTRVAKRFRNLIKYKEGHVQYESLSDKEKEFHKVFRKSIIDKHTVTLSGINLAHILDIAAYEIGEDDGAKKILEEASLINVNAGVGGFVGMSDELYEKVPHAKEPDLALELLNVVNDAENSVETAYKVSLRKTRKSEWGFHWDYVKRVSYGEKMIILDAYGSDKIYGRICNREVKTIDIKCKCRDNVAVFHTPINTSRKYMDNEKYRLRLFYTYIVPVLKNNIGNKVLIYTQKRYESWLRTMIERSDFDFSSVSIKWFWLDRGDDNYGDFDELIIFGTAYSNVIADMHLVNAMYAGEEPIDFSLLKNKEYKDDRVSSIKTARQDNEMMQAIFRLRPSKPRDKPQNIHIFSNMRLPLSEEMPGAIKKLYYDPNFNTEDITQQMIRMYNHFGFYSNLMAPFVYETDLLIDWYEAGASLSDKSLMLTYEEYRHRLEVFTNFSFYKRTVKAMGKTEKVEGHIIEFNKKNIPIYGDTEKAKEFIEQLRLEFREPGCDNDYPVDEKEQEPVESVEPVEPEDQDESEEEQVEEESQHVNDPNELFKILRSVKFMSDEEFDKKYAAYAEYLDHSGTDTS